MAYGNWNKRKLMQWLWLGMLLVALAGPVSAGNNYLPVTAANPRNQCGRTGLDGQALSPGRTDRRSRRLAGPGQGKDP